MKRELLFGVVLALATSVGLGAEHKQHDHGTAMLTGCLAPLNQKDSAIGTTGAADTSKTSRHTPERFALLNPQAGPATAPSNGDVTPSANEQVLLQGANLKKYAGHNVEVRGEFVENKEASAAQTERAGHDDHQLRTFRVAAVTNVDGNCSTSGR